MTKLGQKPTLENIETNPPELVDIWMVYLGQEPDLWRSHGIIVREEELELENATCLTVSWVIIACAKD